MTIEPLLLNETSSIAYPEYFYPAQIEVAHHQLRNFISTVYEGKIFYVNKHDIYVLDLDSHQRSLLVTVEFETRCLAAAHGWVCVGGEAKGDCAFIHIGEHDGEPGDFCYDIEVKMLGKEIVNAMNIQVLKPDPADVHAKDETVVLISNNDHTVTVYSLSQRVVLTTIDHPQPMNYATLSPDSTVMATVGDENKVHFLKRCTVQSHPDTSVDVPYFAKYEWQYLASPELSRGILQPEDFSFAVAFSPNGCLCAVSSQGGAITVFNMDAITDLVEPAEDAIICTFRSSRDSVWGCVRSMAFSPAHWDLLAWTEDHGRIGLADVRQGFQRRQHLSLDKEKAKRVDIYDSTPSTWQSVDHKERMRLQHQQRMQVLRGHPPLGARVLGVNQAPVDSTLGLRSNDNNNLSEREHSMNQALDTTLDGSARRPYSVNYTSPHPETRPSVATTESRREYDVQLLNPGSRFMPSHIPMRRSSIVLNDSSSPSYLVVDEASRMTMTASPGPMSDDGMAPPMSTNDLTPTSGSSSSPLPYNIPPSDPWHVIERSLAARRQEGATYSRLLASLQQLENAIQLERQLSDRIGQQLADEQRLSNLLRNALDARETLQQSRQQEAQSDQPHDSRLHPRIEHLLARELSHDLDQCQVRLEQLMVMIQNVPRRVNYLTDERETLSQRFRRSATHGSSSASFAQSSALPTVMNRHDTTGMEERMLRIEEERQHLMQQIEDMEREVTRAGHNIELASLPNEPIQGDSRDRPRTRGDDREGPTSLISRLRAVPQGDSNTSSSLPSAARSNPSRVSHPLGDLSTLSVTARRFRHRVSADLSSSNNRATMPRAPEPANRFTQADIYTARLLLQRNNMDPNGNWRRIASNAQSSITSAPAMVEILREGGIGTAGIGWSPDGLRLFAGSEHGIFEFKLNVMDRFQFPLTELR